ncbi:c-type cytochrome biogenesis protein CcmI [Aliiroseovarius sp. F20344]|uniref:c-type cytochrome biogenesis protein CcmI n=1 Tax=Aliiroseovarius sp. F20344 TaxID=2926414 RepID=UPI001FF23DE6|nr:c-type cytochrome biogenesis protein CcmI [Aliiroseovarius sp. F20344]MCK0143343.1 c-type cytochrome biogenesis protein CcmI [Aliiroseovarius sp. F20344]
MENWTFWAIVGAATLATILVLARRMLAASPKSTSDESAMSSDMKVYRDQLSELDRDIARGTVSKEDADRARVEISRRLLDADKVAQARRVADAPDGLTRVTMAIAAIVLTVSSFGLYYYLGVPGAQDLGREKRLALSQEMHDNRPAQAEIEAQAPAWPGPPPEAPDDYLKLIDGLRAAVKERPEDQRGLDLLAQHEAAIGNMIAAREAMAQLLAVKGEAATADDYVRQADLMVNAAGGYVSPEAEEMLRRALSRDAGHQLGRYYTGIMFAQNGRPDLAFRLWRGLLEEGPADAIWWSSVRSQIDGLAALAGENYTAPDAPAPQAQTGMPALSGPSAEDMQAAAELSEAERAEMIQSMVERLSDRLATEGGSPEEWARLISVLGVTGDTERAAAIWSEAQDRFAAHPEALATVEQAARQAGVAQ